MDELHFLIYPRQLSLVDMNFDVRPICIGGMDAIHYVRMLNATDTCLIIVGSSGLGVHPCYVMCLNLSNRVCVNVILFLTSGIRLPPVSKIETRYLKCHEFAITCDELHFRQ